MAIPKVEISVLIASQFKRNHHQLAAWLIGIMFCLLQGAGNAQSFPVTQNFTNTSATSNGWILGNSAVLTGNGTIDPVGSGWLRLTDNGSSRKGFATFGANIPTPQGISVEFEYKTWGGTGYQNVGQKGDGFTVFMYDGNATGTFNIGDFGGSLGYANGVVNTGISNPCTTASNQVAGTYRGYFGLGFDEYGNYSNPNDRCKTGGPGVQQEQVALRGPWNYIPTAGSKGYEYLTSSGPLTASIDTGLTDPSRPSDSAFFRKVLILIEPIPASTLYKLTVKWQTTVGAAYSTILGPYTMPTAPPSNLKIGFAASTGGATNYHEIRNLSIQKPTNLKVLKTLSSGLSAPLNPLTNISYTLQVTNEGPNAISDAILTDVIPAPIANVSFTCTPGSGSTCSSASGSLPNNNLNLTLGLPLAGTATITVSGELLNIAASRTLTNTATISLPATSQFNDLNPNDDSSTINTKINGFSVTGVAFNDANTNSFYDPGLDTLLTSTYLPSLTGTDDLGNSITRTATGVIPSGSYIFADLPVGNYSITGVNRSGLTPGEVFTTPATLVVNISAWNLTNQWFGYFKGRKLTGTVFSDDGRSASNSTTIANANNALQNAGETGVQNINLNANGTLSSGGTAVSLLAKTDLQGHYTLWIPSTWSANLTVSHTSSVPTGSNQSGASVLLASSFEAPSARSIALTGQVNGTVYGGLNFGLVPRNVLQPDQFGSTSSPGSVRYLHFFRPGTLGTLTLATSSSSGFNFIFYRDTNCDAVIDVSEHAAPMMVSSITVDQTWPREASGGFKACGLEVEVLAPAGKAPTVVDIATITGAMVWTNNTAVTDTVRVIDTTKLLGVAGNLQLTKGVSNITQGIALSTSTGGKPGEELEYCISYKNVGTTAVSSMVMTDPIPFFTTFVPGSIKLNGVAQPDGTTEANGFITVNVGAVVAGAGGTVCYRVTIK